MSETFEEFKNSFAYGTRTDLIFKLMREMSPEAAADYLQELLRRVGASLDDGDFARVVEQIVDGQSRAYAPRPGAKVKWRYDDGPFAPLAKPLAECRVGLLSSGGVFVDGHDPEPFGVKDMTQEEATRRISDFFKVPPELTEVPVTTPRAELRVRHGGYDVRGAQADPNVVLPVDALRDAARDGTIGELHEVAWSFAGTTAQGFILKDRGPKWVERFRAAELDAMVMVPV